MGSLPRDASRLIPAAFILLACAPGRASRSTAALPEAWSARSCLVADTAAPTADTLYLIGTGPHREDADSVPPDCADLGRGARAPVVVRLTPPPDADLRDVLDVGIVVGGDRRHADVMVTRDPGVLAYAERRMDHLIAALPWSATYVLVAARPAMTPPLPSAEERDALGRDAVTTHARGAAGPFPWLTDSSCAQGARSSPAASRSVIAYEAGDTTARQVAERIASLASVVPRPAWLAAVMDERVGTAMARVMPLAADSIPVALASGRAALAVRSVARDPRMRCGTPGDARVPAGAIPLVDTRAHAIVRRGSGAAFLVAPDGSLHFIRRGRR